MNLTIWHDLTSNELLRLLSREVPDSQSAFLQHEIHNLEQQILKSQQNELRPGRQTDLLRQRIFSSETLNFSRYQLAPEKDQRNLENWLKANERIATWIGNDLEFSLGKIQELHAVLSGHSEPTQWRTRNISLGNVLCPSYEDIPQLLNLLTEYYDQSKDLIHPIILAARVYQGLISIHPFEDGNGRLARFVLDWILGKNGFPPVSFKDPTKSYVMLSPYIPSNFPPGHETFVVLDGVQNTVRILFEE